MIAPPPSRAVPVVVACLALGCANESFAVPLGFVGSVGACHAKRADGALRLDERGWVHGERLGRGSVECDDGHSYTVGVHSVAALVLEGPDAIARGEAAYYSLRVRGPKGEELDLVDESNIDWSATPNATIKAAPCSDMPMFRCPGASTARVVIDTGDATDVTVRYLGRAATKHVTIR